MHGAPGEGEGQSGGDSGIGRSEGGEFRGQTKRPAESSNKTMKSLRKKKRAAITSNASSSAASPSSTSMSSMRTNQEEGRAPMSVDDDENDNQGTATAIEPPASKQEGNRIVPNFNSPCLNFNRASQHPAVFQCKGCRYIIGDTNALFFPHHNEDIAVLYQCSSAVEVGKIPISSAEGDGLGSAHYSVACGNCHAVLGKKYIATSKSFDHLRDKYALDVASIAAYELKPMEQDVKSGNDQVQSAGLGNELPGDKLAEIKEMIKQSHEDSKQEISKIKYTILALMGRMSKLEAAVEEDEDDDDEEQEEGDDRLVNGSGENNPSFVNKQRPKASTKEGFMAV